MDKSMILLLPLAGCVLYLIWFLVPFLLGGAWVLARAIVRRGPGRRFLDGPAYDALFWVAQSSPARASWTRP